MRKIKIKYALGVCVMVLLAGLIIGYNLSDTSFYCHVDRGEVEEFYSFLGARVGDHHFGRFISENMSIRQAKYIYDSNYPMSNGVLELELSLLCD